MVVCWGFNRAWQFRVRSVGAHLWIPLIDPLSSRARYFCLDVLGGSRAKKSFICIVKGGDSAQDAISDSLTLVDVAINLSKGVGESWWESETLVGLKKREKRKRIEHVCETESTIRQVIVSISYWRVTLFYSYFFLYSTRDNTSWW